jgi:hypothetical protein
VERDWIEFALRLAQGARAKVAEDRQQLEIIRKRQSAATDEHLVVASQREA